MPSAKPGLTGQELEIMKVVWTLESATVRQVYETLLKKRHIAYTTVMTMVLILESKGYLKRRRVRMSVRPSCPRRRLSEQWCATSSTGSSTVLLSRWWSAGSKTGVFPKKSCRTSPP